MLQHIYIKNFALIDELELTLENNATMITGETGAGKSIILGAIDLALGQRASTDKIKQGEHQAEVILSFDISKTPPAQGWLTENAFNDGDDCIIRRIIYSDGKSRNFLNGRPTSLQAIKELSKLLILLHGQHNNQLLLSKLEQTKMLDAFAHHFALLDQVGATARHWHKIQNEMTELAANNTEKKQRIEFLKFQLTELDELSLSREEILNLPEQHKRLAHAEELMHHYQHALNLLQENDENNVLSQLYQTKVLLQKIQSHDSQANNLIELLDSATIQLEETSAELQQSAKNIELNPEQLNILEEEMSLVHTLSRKHHVLPEELPEFKIKLAQELNHLEQLDNNLENLKSELDTAQKHYIEQAKKLSNSRAEACKKLNPIISSLIRELGMPQAIFSATIIPNESQVPHAKGDESIEFMMQTNQGSPSLPINKIASGGELARTSLALQTTLAQHINIPTLIFDEIDVGISGKTAAVVGKQLQKLSKSHQIICITHQPQVAASGQHHWTVNKSITDKSVTVTIDSLNKPQRIEEIARMLGGIKMTKQTLAHAEEMLDLHQES